VLAAALVAGACAPATKQQTKPESAAPAAPKAAVHAGRHMIAAANPLAAEAGREILRAGGSAVDAAIAAQMVLNLVEPQSSGIGGGGFVMHFSAETGDIQTYDGRETAPASATPDMFLDRNDKPMKFYDAVVGGLSVGVPGLLRVLELAHRDHGRLPWAKLFEAAIGLAEKGFPVSPRLNGMIARDKHLKTFDAARGFYYGDDGKAPAVGSTLTNKALAETLKTIAREGADAFYSGPIASDIVETLRAARRNPSGMTLADLMSYEAKTRAPLCQPYRLWLVCGMAPPTSGGITTLQILGILQEFDLGALKPGTAGAVHLIAEASRLAYADRGSYIADPDFVQIPLAGLLDPRYLKKRGEAISPDRGMGKAKPGTPDGQAALRWAPASDGQGLSTSHISVIDDKGNALSMTTSIESAFGSRLMVRGFMLNNELTDFAFKSEIDGKPVANRVEAGKRPRSSMAPTLVFDGSGRVVMALGSPGGSRIIGYVAKTLVAVLDWKLDVQDAIGLPHFTNRNGATDLEEGTPLAELKSELEALGHKVSLRPLTSGLHAVMTTPEGLVGGADPRREGVALGD
jgi:gamma-glutamyltranspeptidase/glutathione hydrolase